jgi:uncharacterized membrane protein YciS (DUF1049 family)
VALSNITLTLTWPIFGVIYVRDTGRRPKQKNKKKRKQTNKQNKTKTNKAMQKGREKTKHRKLKR